MPWLAGTAFLHSIMVQERRGMLKVWNVSLIVGDVLARAARARSSSAPASSQSIHAFGASTVGAPLLVLIAVVVLGSTALIVSRLDDLRSERRIDSLLSRESIFLVNNLLLVGLCVVIFWGTFFPLISEAFTGDEVLARRRRGSTATRRRSRSCSCCSPGSARCVAWRRISVGTRRGARSRGRR